MRSLTTLFLILATTCAFGQHFHGKPPLGQNISTIDSVKLTYNQLTGKWQSEKDNVNVDTNKLVAEHYYHYYLEYKALRDSIDSSKSDTIIRSRLKCIQRFYIDTVTGKKYYYYNYKLNLFK